MGSDQLCSWVGSYRNLGRGLEMTRNFDYLRLNSRSRNSGYSVFPFYIGKLKITIFHFLLSCTIVFSLVWGYFIYSVVEAALRKAGDSYQPVGEKSENGKSKDNFHGTKFRIM